MSRKLGKHRVLRFAGPAFALALLVPTGAAGAAPAPAPAPAATAAPAHFMVVGPVGNLDRTEKSVRAAGGTVVQSWPQIGVLVATSTDAGFAAAVRGRPGVQQAGASRNLVEWLPPANSTMLEPTEGTLSAPASIAAAGDAEPLEAEQWDLPLIKADKAHLLSQGDKDVTVGVLDYGIDPTHPDLKPNLDVSRSVSCVDQGIPDPSPAAWAPENAEQDHGTHVAGTVAAARNGIGVAGVAPDVTLASVRVIDDDGFIYPEYAVCGFVWAAEHGFDVTNNSYFVDPWYLWCDSDPDQKAAAEAVRRAVAYASRKDVVTVASAGNSNWDLSKPILDQNSPNNGGPVQERQTGDECRILPAELDGVVTVSSVGVKSEKSYFANYGLGSIDVTAPGGDARQIPQTPSANGRILSTLPGGGWGWKQGTSMSGPHAAGVVALLRSTHPDWNAKQVTRVLQAQADRLTCPDFYDPNGDGKADAVCEGGRTGAGFHGAGMVDALDAVR